MVDSTNVDVIDAAVQRFKALGDPTRLRILQILTAGERCVCEVQEEVGVAPNLLSHHLKVLREAGLVLAKRRGRWIDYRLDLEGLAALAAALPSSTASSEAPVCACRSEARELRA